MGLSHLRTFHYCATYLSFSKTAQHFELSQPAITKQIKKLESDLGQALFIRAGRKLFLTAAGEALFEYSSQIFRLYEDALDTMQDLSEKKRKLRIVGDLNYMKMNLSEFFAKAYERFPDIEIEINTAENAKLIFSGVRDKQYDIGILSANYTTIGVRGRLLREDNIYLVSSTGLASRMRREPDLQPPLLFYKSESSYSSFLQEFMHRNGLSDQNRMTFNSLEMIRQALLKDAGIAILSEDVIKEDILAGRVTILSTPVESLKIKTRVIYRTDNPILHNIEECIKLIVAETSKF
ncbi:LysR family transcriptional regulator [Trichococcus collinsii]|uniref:DNA-binding transcriptional regulator, LysR family n=1 Tax=Trichococcus collinsii TaxID=157076 RepID=A0AB38A2H6_9LACT|nr:LysR family transcriptional regulator [Trichococcus collinsii]CZQ98954.1 transcription regulator hth lysr [Trichococcus collinsii]SEA79179.1 DNA-binding transcriptional regulator, LysR family [Trichococcus collinsii]